MGMGQSQNVLLLEKADRRKWETSNLPKTSLEEYVLSLSSKDIQFFAPVKYTHVVRTNLKFPFLFLCRWAKSSPLLFSYDTYS